MLSVAKARNGETNCILWSFAKDRDGYGQIKINKKQQKAHRYSWEIFND